MKESSCSIPGICGLSLLHELLPPALVHALQLKVPTMRRRPAPLSLQQHERDGPNDWDEVQWQVHEVPDEGLRRELREWLGHELTQARDRVGAGFDLTILGDEGSHVLGEERLQRSSVPCSYLYAEHAIFTPSNVSIRASSISIVLLSTMLIVLLSLSTRRAALTAASGPLVKARTATWGK